MSKVYQCHKCGGTFVPNDDVKVACAVLHGVDDCCHYGEQQISHTPTKDPNNELDELREILGDEDWKYSEKPARLQALIDKKVTEARIDEFNIVNQCFNVLGAEITPKSAGEVIKKRLLERKAQLSKPKEEER